MHAVEPDIRVLVDPVEPQLYAPLDPSRAGMEREVLAVPADPADRVTDPPVTNTVVLVERADHRRRNRLRGRRLGNEQGRIGRHASLSGGRVGQILDGPVVRKIQRTPGAVVERHLLGAARIAAVEEPSLVERLLQPAGLSVLDAGPGSGASRADRGQRPCYRQRSGRPQLQRPASRHPSRWRKVTGLTEMLATRRPAENPRAEGRVTPPAKP